MAPLRPGEWSWSQILLAGLTLSVLLGILVAFSTSGAAFGVYNSSWEGASGLTELADDTDTETQIALNTTAYTRPGLESPPTETVAIVLSPDAAYSQRDRARLRRFVANGGTLVVAEDIGPVGNTLLAAVGAQTRFDGRPVRDERYYHRSPAFPTATNVTDAPETEGVDQVTLNHGTTLRTNPDDTATEVLVRTSSFAYLDGNRNSQLDDNETMATRPVIVREEVGNGTVIAVSDPSLFINVMLEQPGNRRFVQNLFSIHQQVLLDYSGHDTQPPLAVALLTLRGSPLMQAIVGLMGIGAVLVWSRQPAYARELLSRLTTGRAGSAPAGEQEKTRVDADVLATSLHQTHPEWDEERVRRVITGVLARRREEDDDDYSG